MKNSVFFNLVFLLLFKHKNRHLSIFFISSFLVFLLASFLFVKDSLRNELLNNIKVHSDFVVQKVFAGKKEDIALNLIDKIENIYGVKEVKPRVYGLYYFLSEGVFFTIVGVDFFEDNLELRNLLEVLDIKEFLAEDFMIVGEGVKRLFDKYHYFDTYDFTLANKQRKKVKIFKALPKELNLIANDLIIMDINLARKILNIQKDKASDIILNVPNELEKVNIKEKLLKLDSDLKVIQKEELVKDYENIFNYKGGVFLILFIVAFFTFFLILYQRYSNISSKEAKQIAILKALGYSIKDILKIKMTENFILAFVSYLCGVILAYFYVFSFNAFIIKDIFIGFSNIQNDFVLNPFVNFLSFFSLFLLFIIPFLTAILIPVWKIASIDSFEALK